MYELMTCCDYIASMSSISKPMRHPNPYTPKNYEEMDLTAAPTTAAPSLPPKTPSRSHKSDIVVDEIRHTPKTPGNKTPGKSSLRTGASPMSKKVNFNVDDDEPLVKKGQYDAEVMSMTDKAIERGNRFKKEAKAEAKKREMVCRNVWFYHVMISRPSQELRNLRLS